MRFMAYSDLLPVAYSHRAQELEKVYLPKAIGSEGLNTHDAYLWMQGTLNALVDAQITMHHAAQILRDIWPREGVRECFEFLWSHNIPIAIVSYSVRQFIECALVSMGLRKYVADI